MEHSNARLNLILMTPSYFWQDGVRSGSAHHNEVGIRFYAWVEGLIGGAVNHCWI
jgi:hypothetical protein